MSSTPRVAVLGGGVIGVSAATHLARAGADVVLVSEHDLASGASGRSLSWLNSFGGSRSEAYHRLRLAGIDRYRTLNSRLGSSPNLRFDGGLTWAAPGAEQGLRDQLEHMRHNGYDAHWLQRSEVEQWAPGIDPAAVPDDGAIFNPGEGWVDLAWLVPHLAAELTACGGRIVTNRGAAGVEVKGEKAHGLVLADGERFEADVVLVAAGADTPKIMGELGVKIADATPSALLVWTKPVSGSLRAVLNTPRVSLRPHSDGSIAMDSDAAAAEVIVHADGRYEVLPSTIENLMREASAVLAHNPTLALAGFGAGPKPIPGDGDPVLGATTQVAGLHVAFTHSGATLGLIAGELLADEIVAGTPNAMLAAFSPDRFQ